jgi:putative ABC transport system substrate-binding protein
VSAFWQALNQAGLVENRDVVVIYHWGEHYRKRLPALALDLCPQGVSIIVANGASSTVAATQATETIPIIFVAASDSPGSGFDLEHPNGNITGISLASPDLLVE